MPVFVRAPLEPSANASIILALWSECGSPRASLIGLWKVDRPVEPGGCCIEIGINAVLPV